MFSSWCQVFSSTKCINESFSFFYLQRFIWFHPIKKFIFQMLMRNKLFFQTWSLSVFHRLWLHLLDIQFKVSNNLHIKSLNIFYHYFFLNFQVSFLFSLEYCIINYNKFLSRIHKNESSLENRIGELNQLWKCRN